ncbi:hypothetical protein A33Q_1473 [Indibacter alkaliphilus LW1]|uniref:Uncharacterized protein n=1 Tax=Indibacter alkaliphilus (strain CCUG 57479 / KCTC 22604 / LW1) TaxID=1189612 RepID=S2E0Z9_INDAL|nr:hypothetical protein A33Q_1473 [Indibacter alkaliphilus LW1]
MVQFSVSLEFYGKLETLMNLRYEVQFLLLVVSGEKLNPFGFLEGY